MSVPVNQRKQGKLEVCLKAHDLCVYTLQITKNEKVFVKDYQAQLTDKIVQCAMDIHLNIWMANNCRVACAEDYALRRRFQNLALSNCVSLLSLIDLAQSIFHLSGKRVTYWSQKVIDVRTLVRSWKASDAQRYKTKDGM